MRPSDYAWLNGGYPGSRKLTLHVLSAVPGAELRRSWILTSPQGHAHLPTDILSDLGLGFPDQYEEVARAQTGYLNEEQILWRPRSAKAPACSDSCDKSEDLGTWPTVPSRCHSAKGAHLVNATIDCLHGRRPPHVASLPARSRPASAIEFVTDLTDQAGPYFQPDLSGVP